MRGPARGAGDHKQGRKQGRGDAHERVGNRRKPVQIGEHLFFLPHDGFNTRGDIKAPRITGHLGQAPGDGLDHPVARIADGIDRMPEADHDLLLRHARPDIRLRLIGRGIALLYVEGNLIGAAMFRPAQRPYGPRDAGIQIRTRAGDHAPGKGGGVIFMLGV